MDFNPQNISDTSDEEEQDDAMLFKMTAHKDQLKTNEEHITNELSKQTTPSEAWAVRLPPKTKAESLMEKEEDMKIERNRRYTQIFKLANGVKQFDALASTHKKFEKQEDLLEWLQDVLE